MLGQRNGRAEASQQVLVLSVKQFGRVRRQLEMPVGDI